MGAELGARGKKEGYASDQEERVEGACRGGLFTRQPPARAGAQGGAPHLRGSRSARPRLQPLACQVSVIRRGDTSPAVQGAFERRDSGLPALATFCHILPVRPW